MTFGKLLKYVERDQAGTLWEDSAFRAYDLSYGQGPLRLRMALYRAGYRGSETSLMLAECKADIGSCGLLLPLPTIKRLAQEWYIWQRLNDGEITRWKYRIKKEAA